MSQRPNPVDAVLCGPVVFLRHAHCPILGLFSFLVPRTGNRISYISLHKDRDIYSSKAVTVKYFHLIYLLYDFRLFISGHKHCKFLQQKNNLAWKTLNYVTQFVYNNVKNRITLYLGLTDFCTDLFLYSLLDNKIKTVSTINCFIYSSRFTGGPCTKLKYSCTIYKQLNL